MEINRTITEIVLNYPDWLIAASGVLACALGLLASRVAWTWTHGDE